MNLRHLAEISFNYFFFLKFAAGRKAKRLDQRGRPTGRRPLQDRQIRTDKVLSDSPQGQYRDIRVGAETLPQIHGVQIVRRTLPQAPVGRSHGGGGHQTEGDLRQR